MSEAGIATPPPVAIGSGLVSRVACGVVQPLLSRVVRRIAARHPSLFARLGPHQGTDFLIDPTDMPFALHLRPDPESLVFRAVPRDAAPQAGAITRGRFMLLLELIDSGEDGDAAFFSRDLEVTGDTEAVVRLRNALDDVEGSIAEETAAMFGPPVVPSSGGSGAPIPMTRIRTRARSDSASARRSCSILRIRRVFSASCVICCPSASSAVRSARTSVRVVS